MLELVAIARGSVNVARFADSLIRRWTAGTSADLPLPAQEILSYITHSIVEGVAGITGCEAKLAARFRVVEVPEIFRHLYGVGLDRRSKIPLPKQRVDYMGSGDREL